MASKPMRRHTFARLRQAIQLPRKFVPSVQDAFHARKPKRSSVAAGLLALLCAAVAIGAQRPLTSLMSLHMLVQIPLLVLAGLLAEQATWPKRVLIRRRRTYVGIETTPKNNSILRNNRHVKQNGPAHRQSWPANAYGIPGLVLASLVGAAWMIPKALDDALVDWRVATFKYLGLPVCGWVLSASLRAAPTVVKLFFLGNFCWMSAIVGMLYLDQPVRLCNAYLLNDQSWTGRGLIGLAIALPLFWLFLEIRRRWPATNSNATNVALPKRGRP